MNRFQHIFVGCVGAVAMLLCARQPTPAFGQRPDGSARARQQMVQNQVVGRGISNPRVIEAMGRVPRHQFVPADMRKYAYSDSALPIGNGQTITSPFVVSFMTEKLELATSDRVLEIGTGSGYQASVLSRLVADVYTIEIVEPLGRRAARTIARLGYDNVHCKIGDGYKGWPEHAPFDKIIVTCSPEKVPPALVAQLREGGRLIVPLGERFQQSLYLFKKAGGKLEKEQLEATFFVPMTGRAEELRVNKGDSGIPEVVNGSFEEFGKNDEVIGWFYSLQAKVVRDNTAPAGRHVLMLSNDKAGARAHLLQPVGVDGRELKSIELSARVKTYRVSSGATKSALPRVEVTFYDERRAPIRTVALGPWQGDRSWLTERKRIPVPGRSRLAVIAIAMFGATGQIAVDDIQIRSHPTEKKD